MLAMFGLVGSRLILVSLIFTRLVCPSLSMWTRWDVGQDGREILYTQAPVKRDAAICPTGQSLCPAAVNGGCCPTGQYSCGTDSCYAVTPQTGIALCGVDQGGGSCPSGYACVGNGCSPLPGVAYTQTCGTGSYLCPTSVAYGCCRSGLACGKGFCLQTSYASATVTQTIIAVDSSSHITTIISVIQTAFVPSSESMAQITAAAVTTESRSSTIPTAVAKVSPTSESSSALSTVALGGIIGAAVAVLLGIAIATYCIIRRLNAVAKASRSSGSSSRSKNKSKRPSDGRPTRSSTIDPNFDTISVNPLMMSSSSTAGTPRLYHPAATHHSSSESGLASPPIPAPYAGPQGFGQVVSSDQRSDHQHSRRPSGQSSAPMNSTDGNWYPESHSTPEPALRDQNMWHGRTSPRLNTTGHARDPSDASETSQQSDSSGGFVELDAGDAERRAMLGRTGLSHHSYGRPSHEINALGLGRRRNLSTVAASLRVELPTSPLVGRTPKNVRETEGSQLAVGGEGGPSTRTGPAISETDREYQAERSRRPNPTANEAILDNSNEAPKKMTRDAADLERQLERLEGQKIMGSRTDFLRGRRQ